MKRQGLLASIGMAALLAGCSVGGAGPAAPLPDQSEVCRPRASVNPQRSVDDCLRVARALDKALTAALTSMLPPGATLSNSTDDQSGHELGGPGVQFNRTIDQSGGDRFQVSVRIRDGGVPFNLYLRLGKYDYLPQPSRCEVDPALAAARKSAGQVVVECRVATVDGGTLYRQVMAFPYGSGEYAKLLIPIAEVELYRTDGVMVGIEYRAVIEHDPRPITPGTVPMNLTVDQLVAIANRPDLAIT
jgi:hypothetical protein